MDTLLGTVYIKTPWQGKESLNLMEKKTKKCTLKRKFWQNMCYIFSYIHTLLKYVKRIKRSSRE